MSAGTTGVQLTPANATAARRTRYLAVAAATATGIFVGSTIVATRFVIGQTTPGALAFLRYTIGFCCLLPPALLAGWPRFARRDLLPLALLGITQFGILVFLPLAMGIGAQGCHQCDCLSRAESHHRCRAWRTFVRGAANVALADRALLRRVRLVAGPLAGPRVVRIPPFALHEGIAIRPNRPQPPPPTAPL